MFFKRLAQKLKSSVSVLKGTGRVSFSQAGEDRILEYLFHARGIAQPSYLDIGANHPSLGSNTYFFYLRGSKGVLVEPHPQLYNNIKIARPRDVVLNIGIGLNEAAAADFYAFPPPYTGWNTFSTEEAQIRKEEGISYKEVLRIPLRNVNDILAAHFKLPPDFISIDVEGLDFEIVRSLNFGKWAPLVLVVETLRMGESKASGKQTEMIDFICAKGYAIYADTYINTIFVRKEAL